MNNTYVTQDQLIAWIAEWFPGFANQGYYPHYSALLDIAVTADSDEDMARRVLDLLEETHTDDDAWSVPSIDETVNRIDWEAIAAAMSNNSHLPLPSEEEQDEEEDEEEQDEEEDEEEQDEEEDEEEQDEEEDEEEQDEEEDEEED
jgi:hypothetical protein